MLKQLAEKSLRANFEQVGSSFFLTAGRNQFRSLWVRDFCFSVPALLAMGESKLVRDQLDLIWSHQNEAGLLPRGLDSMSPKLRVVRAVLKLQSRPLEMPLEAEYKGEHGTIALDSCLLTIWASFLYAEHTQDQAWLEQLRPVINKTLQYLLGYEDRGLLLQPKFSDWQDSVRRKGKTAFVNLWWWWVLREIEGRGWQFRGLPLAEDVEHEFKRTFLRDGHYRSLAVGPWVSLDVNLLMIYLGLEKDPKALWEIVKELPPMCTSPNYPSHMVSFFTRMSGYRHYHDETLWTWLLGLRLVVAKQVQDEIAYKIFRRSLEQELSGEEFVPELLRELSLLLESESPFSWGAAWIYLGG